MLQIIETPIDMHALYDAVRTDASGAVVVFLGVVRRRSDDDRDVSGLSYEAYGDLALAEMQRIESEVRSRWNGCDLAMVHRVGDLAVGEPSVCVAVATAHRAEAFAACKYAIDELKNRVPIWKKEHYADGSADWRENCKPGEVAH